MHCFSKDVNSAESFTNLKIFSVKVDRRFSQDFPKIQGPSPNHQISQTS